MGVITIKGYHGTDINSCEAILESNYKISEGDQHWLGEGVYFFIEGLSTDTINLAKKWAIAEAWDNDNKKYKYTELAVIESLIEVEEDKILDFIEKNFGKEVYLAGNSIHQDKRFIVKEWPRLDARLHYRMFDVSAWKIYFENALKIKFTKRENHRALDDIEGSIEEIKYYLGYVKKDPS